MADAQTVFRWGAWVLGAFALVPGYYAVRLRWTPAADFDVIGILWLLQNTPKITAIGLTGCLLAGAAWFWIRSIR